VQEVRNERADGQHFSVEYRMVPPDGRFASSISRQRVPRRTGPRRRTFGISQDITERVRAEEQLKATTEQLRVSPRDAIRARRREHTHCPRAFMISWEGR